MKPETTMWHELIYKQWMEQAWRIVFATVILCGFVAIGLWARVVPDRIVLVFGGVFAMTLMPIFIAMGLVAPYRADRSFEMLTAMPIEPWKLFAVTVGVGAVGCVLPIAGSWAVAMTFAGSREMSTAQIAEAYFGAFVLGWLLMFWTLCLSLRQQHESRVGLIGLGVVVGALALAMVAFPLARDATDGYGRWLIAMHPLNLLRLLGLTRGAGPGVMTTIAWQALFAAMLGVWTVRRFGRI